MHPQLESLFDEAENRYLKPEELGVLSQYVDSLPVRLTTYRSLRDCELEVMQRVADQLQAQFPNEKTEVLERAIRNALLALRYCAMGMLLNDEAFVKNRLLDWLTGPITLYHNSTVNEILYRLLNQRLSEALGSQSMTLLSPYLVMAQTLLYEQTSSPVGVK